MKFPLPIFLPLKKKINFFSFLNFSVAYDFLSTTKLLDSENFLENNLVDTVSQFLGWYDEN